MQCFMGRSDEANHCAARTTEVQVSKWTTARTLWWLSVGLKSRHARRWSVSQSSPQTDPDSCPSRPWLPPSEPVNKRQQVATVTGSKWPHRYSKGVVELCNLLHRNVLIHLCHCLYHSLPQVINMSRHSQTSPSGMDTLADGNQRIWIREKMLEFSSTLLSTLSPYLHNTGCHYPPPLQYYQLQL